MNYHNITKEDMLNGDGIRVVLWVSGCNRNCYNCQNPQTHDKNSGIKFDEDAMSELLMALKPDYIQGLTLSGGHPLEGYNVSEVERIVKRVKDEYPNKDIWIYTGYDFDYIYPNKRYERILYYTDVIVDGRYVDLYRDVSLPYRGSSNQHIWRKIKGKWVIDNECI